MSERATANPEPQSKINTVAQPRVSYRALGISNIFFGLLSGVGALANWSSGKGVERAMLSAMLALSLIVMGIIMVHSSPARRR